MGDAPAPRSPLGSRSATRRSDDPRQAHVSARARASASRAPRGLAAPYLVFALEVVGLDKTRNAIFVGNEPAVHARCLNLSAIFHTAECTRSQLLDWGFVHEPHSKHFR